MTAGSLRPGDDDFASLFAEFIVGSPAAPTSRSTVACSSWWTTTGRVRRV
jgi:hypothetical protein